MKPCMPGRNISTLLNLIYFENLFRDIGFSSSYCFVPVYLSRKDALAKKESRDKATSINVPATGVLARKKIQNIIYLPFVKYLI